MQINYSDSSSYTKIQDNSATGEREDQPSSTASFAQNMSQPQAKKTPPTKPSKNLFAKPLQAEADRAMQTPVHQSQQRLQLDVQDFEDA